MVLYRSLVVPSFKQIIFIAHLMIFIQMGLGLGLGAKARAGARARARATARARARYSENLLIQHISFTLK